MAKQSYGGVQVTTNNWDKLHQTLIQAFSSGKEASVELGLDRANEVTDYFANYLVSGCGQSHVFLQSLKLTHRHRTDALVAVNIAERCSEVILSSKGLDYLIEGIQELADDKDPDLDEWPIMSEQDMQQCLRLHPYPRRTPGLPRG